MITELQLLASCLSLSVSLAFFLCSWVLYEKPNFKGEKIALDEGDIEITYPFGPPEEGMEDGQQQQQQSGQTAQREQNGTREQNGEKENGEKENGGQEGEEGNTIPVRRFIIGSIRRAVRVRDVQLIHTHSNLMSPFSNV